MRLGKLRGAEGPMSKRLVSRLAGEPFVVLARCGEVLSAACLRDERLPRTCCA